MYISWGKRLFDFVAAAVGVLVLSPLLVLIALIIRLGGGGPVVYSQRRIGRNFKPFTLYKFRTMRQGSDAGGNTVTVKNDSRITPVGKILRKYKLDELPQLFNVLRGDMSLVGPRPEVSKSVELFRADYETVLSVRPGITDYAAIEYCNEEEILLRYPNPEEDYLKYVLPEKIKLYKKYIAEISFATDLKILAATFGRIFCKTGGGNLNNGD